MNSEKIRTYDELNIDEKEVLDSFRQMKLLYDHARFKYHRIQVENLINDYETLMKLREDIQAKYCIYWMFSTELFKTQLNFHHYV